MCEYCQKVNNKPLAETDGEYSKYSGIKVCLAYWKKDKRAIISAFGWYDTYVGIQSIETEINFCPMCGRRLSNGS